MNLHESPEACRELIQVTAEHFSVNAFYVEKDYWVTRSLNRLHESEAKDLFVLKGGTSLSKAHQIIRRFSEDMDLALQKHESFSGAQRKRHIKKIESLAAQDLTYQEGHVKESKGSNFRRTAHAFPKLTEALDLGHVSDMILIEVNAFANPMPSAKMPVASLISEFLSSAGRADLIRQYNLEPFSIFVLGVERTLCEKVMSLVKGSYEPDVLEAQRTRIRHFYDIAMIMRQAKFRDFVASTEFLKLIDEVRETDKNLISNVKAWIHRPLAEAVVFSDSPAIWSGLARNYHGSFKQMVFGESIPEDKEILSCLRQIGNALRV